MIGLPARAFASSLGPPWRLGVYLLAQGVVVLACVLVLRTPLPEAPKRYQLAEARLSDGAVERPVRLLTLALVVVLDPMAVVLLLAAGIPTTRAGSR